MIVFYFIIRSMKLQYIQLYECNNDLMSWKQLIDKFLPYPMVVLSINQSPSLQDIERPSSKANITIELANKRCIHEFQIDQKLQNSFEKLRRSGALELQPEARICTEDIQRQILETLGRFRINQVSRFGSYRDYKSSIKLKARQFDFIVSKRDFIVQDDLVASGFES